MPKVLLLLNDRHLVKRVGDYLRIKSYTIDGHTDPQEAILAADSNRPDLVVVDINLAGHSGIEFLFELRSYPEWQTVPVITVGLPRLNELADFLPAFSELQVARYLSWPSTPLPRLEAEINLLLQPAEAKI